MQFLHEVRVVLMLSTTSCGVYKKSKIKSAEVEASDFCGLIYFLVMHECEYCSWMLF